MLVKQVSTSAEFWEFVNLPENQHKSFERHDGEIVEISPSGIYASAVGNRLMIFVGGFVIEHNLGVMTGEQSGYTITPENTFAPDVAFTAFARMPSIPTGFAPLAPDLAIEVVSPSDSALEIHKKVLAYLNAATTLVWVVFSGNRTIAVHTSAGSRTLTVEDTLDGGEVLPGFTLPVRNIFPD